MKNITSLFQGAIDDVKWYWQGKGFNYNIEVYDTEECNDPTLANECEVYLNGELYASGYPYNEIEDIITNDMDCFLRGIEYRMRYTDNKEDEYKLFSEDNQ